MDLRPPSRGVFFPRPSFDIPLPHGQSLSLGPRTLVMGILNVTPDSFADGGRHVDPDRAADAAFAMQEAGADIVDIGGESTRPGADPLPLEEELARVLPVLERLQGRLRIPVSIDTYKAAVASAAIDRGASIVNDISALRYDPALAEVVAGRGAALVLMHNRGRSREMYREARYGAVARDVAAELRERMDAAVAGGVAAERLILDPGIGFAKQAAHSLEVLADLPALASLGRPLLVGPSRKSFLTVALGERPPAEREWGTAAAVAAAVMGGAHIVRVHAVREMVDVVQTLDAIRNHGGSGSGEGSGG
ncbi:MAG TPA: dihydropteroate synthase [Vicinamibacterales bacterium]